MQFARALAGERMRAVRVPVPALALLIKAALGQTLTTGERNRLSAYLGKITPQADQEATIRAATTADQINTAAGGDLWPI